MSSPSPYFPFSGSLRLTGQMAGGNSLHRLLVGGQLLQANIRARSSIGIVWAGEVQSSRVLAGIREDLLGLPSTGTDFLPALPAPRGEPGGKVAAIANFAMTAGLFANSVLAASSIGAAVLRNVPPDNGGTPFGLIVDTKIAMLTRYTGSVATTRTNITASLADQIDFKVQVV